MNPLNAEFKARCYNFKEVRAFLKENDAAYIGIDNQTDTYISLPEGRLKIRSGDMGNKIIYYVRKNKAGTKVSDVSIMENPPLSVQNALMNLFGTSIIVKKRREIYFIHNVKFHLDEVEELGNFLEVEAIDKHRTRGERELEKQCNHYREKLRIKDEDLVAESYSDLLARIKHASEEKTIPK